MTAAAIAEVLADELAQVTPGRDQAIAEFYRTPHSLRDTGERFGISHVQVRRILEKLGVPAHAPSTTLTERPAQSIEVRARQLVAKAIQSGTLVRPEACERCGCRGQTADGRAFVQAHHHRGYDFPLDVEWLCGKCHAVEDGRAAGEDNGRAKLSAADIEEIRRLYQPSTVASKNPKTGNPLGIQGLARRYGVSPRQIGRILRGAAWAA